MTVRTHQQDRVEQNAQANEQGQDVDQSQQFDIVIVGGAMAGATLALGLSQLNNKLKSPLTIALIEAHQVDETHPGFDARSIAISQGSIFELNRLGIWPWLEALGTPIGNIHVSDRGHFGMTELNASQFNLSAMGQVVELERVGQVLFKQLEAANVKVFCPAKLSQIDAKQSHHELKLDSGELLKAKLVVAADGVNSQVRRALGGELTSHSFGQYGLIANVVTDKPHQNWAWERFTDTGPLALLPMSNVQNQSRLSMVWALDEQQAAELQTADKSEFLARLQQAFGNRAGRFIDVGARHKYPLNLCYMPRPIYHRCVYIGNAAQTLHPIAGQGFNLGLRDLVALLQVIEQTALRGEDIGGVNLTHEYLKRRENDRRETISNIEFLVRGFSNDYWPLVAGRSLGLRLLSWVPCLKTPVAHRAMGWK